MLDLCGPGGDLLSRTLRHSTLGAEAFHGRVRDGIGWGRLARATGPAEIKGMARPQGSPEGKVWSVGAASSPVCPAARQGGGKAERPPALMRGAAKRTDVRAGA